MPERSLRLESNAHSSSRFRMKPKLCGVPGFLLAAAERKASYCGPGRSIVACLSLTSQEPVTSEKAWPSSREHRALLCFKLQQTLQCHFYLHCFCQFSSSFPWSEDTVHFPERLSSAWSGQFPREPGDTLSRGFSSPIPPHQHTQDTSDRKLS